MAELLKKREGNEEAASDALEKNERIKLDKMMKTMQDENSLIQAAKKSKVEKLVMDAQRFKKET